MDDGVLVDRARLIEPKSVDVTCRCQPGSAAYEKLPNHLVIEFRSVAGRKIVDVPAVGLRVVTGVSLVPETNVLGRIVRIEGPLDPEPSGSKWL